MIKSKNFRSIVMLTIFLAACSSKGFSQNAATPNPGFENWTQVGNHFDPNNWNTLNPSTSILGVFTCTRATGADVHSGTYAIKLITKSVFGIKANGIASTATLVTTPPYGVSGGIPYTQRPDSLVGWYKYAPASAADSGFAELVLLGANNDTIGIGRFNTPNSGVTAYTRFSEPITYYSPDSPVLAYWILTSSDGVNPVVNSALFIDDIDLIFNPSGINEPNGVSNLHVVSNMVTNELIVHNPSSIASVMRIYDVTGKLISETDILSGTNSINVAELKSGLYFYFVFNPLAEKPATGKLIKL